MGKGKLGQLSDQEIVKAVLSDLKNYKYIIERYQGKLLVYIQRAINVNKEDAEDILQEVFIKVYKNLNSYSEEFKFSSWIYRITHNEAISFLRSNHSKIKVIATDQEKNVFEELASEVDIEAEFIRSSTSKQVHLILSKLDKKYKDVLILRFIEEMDYAEISDILHISAGTVGSLINRAKVKFKELINNNEKSN